MALFPPNIKIIFLSNVIENSLRLVCCIILVTSDIEYFQIATPMIALNVAEEKKNISCPPIF